MHRLVLTGMPGWLMTKDANAHATVRPYEYARVFLNKTNKWPAGQLLLHAVPYRFSL